MSCSIEPTQYNRGAARIQYSVLQIGRTRNDYTVKARKEQSQPPQNTKHQQTNTLNNPK